MRYPRWQGRPDMSRTDVCPYFQTYFDKNNYNKNEEAFVPISQLILIEMTINKNEEGSPVRCNDQRRPDMRRILLEDPNKETRT